MTRLAIATAGAEAPALRWRDQMLKITWTVGLLAVASTVTPIRAEEFVLASAHVVESTDASPVLTLTANGPIAFEVMPASGSSADASVVNVRLYGVHPATDLSLDGLAPFGVTATPLEDGCRVTVSIAAGASGSVLEVRAGARANELVVTLAPRSN